MPGCKASMRNLSAIVAILIIRFVFSAVVVWPPNHREKAPAAPLLPNSPAGSPLARRPLFLAWKAV